MWTPKQPMKCPVCATVLGCRDKHMAVSFECFECNWIFSWDREGTIKPPKRPVKPPKRCNCLSCRGKDEKEG